MVQGVSHFERLRRVSVTVYATKVSVTLNVCDGCHKELNALILPDLHDKYGQIEYTLKKSLRTNLVLTNVGFSGMFFINKRIGFGVRVLADFHEKVGIFL
jgi:hypothetical protein